MSRDRTHLLDILDAARLAIEYVRGKTEPQFRADIQLQDAVIRRLGIVGEAAHRVSEPTRDRLAAVPWREMIDMRNFLIHRYDAVDLAIVWDTLQNDSPRVVAGLESIVSGNAEGEA